MFLFSLVLSTYDQFVATRLRTIRPPGIIKEPEYVLEVSKEQFDRALRKEGYREVANDGKSARYVRSRFGYWGSFFLHLGMTVTVFFSLVYVLTEHRAILRPIAGVTIPVNKGDHAERKGLLSGGLRLPSAILMQSLKPEFWDNDQLKALSSVLVFFDGQMKATEIQMGINDKATYQGTIVYQRSTFGNIFLLEFSTEREAFNIEVMLPMPPDRVTAGYENYEIDYGKYLLMAKYYTSPDRTNMMPDNPQLVLRLMKGEEMLGELSLLKDESGRLGPYNVKFLAVSWWADLLFEGSRGMSGIFSGFALLLFGGMLGYFVIPREVLLCRNGNEYNIAWKAAKFADFFREESERIMSLCRRYHD